MKNNEYYYTWSSRLFSLFTRILASAASIGDVAIFPTHLKKNKQFYRKKKESSSTYVVSGLFL